MSNSQSKQTTIYETRHFPLFSIITITLNNYQGLKKTFKSLKNQSYSDFEWLVIDGKSSDETVEFLRKHRSSTRADTNPFRFVSQADEGIYDAMNTGIDMARGHYLLFLNAGDALANNKVLEELAPLCEKAPDFIYGDALEKYKNRRKPVIKPAESHDDIAWGMFTHHQAMLYRRHKVRDIRLRYSMRYAISSDYDFTARFLLKAQKIERINRPVCIFEMGGISQQQAWLGRKEQYIIREELEMVPIAQNLWILLMQSISWYMKAYCPWLYDALKPAGKQLLKGKKQTPKRLE